MPEWHDQPLIQSILGFEDYFSLIPGLDPDLVVTTLEIYLEKDSGSSEHVQHVIKPWDGEPILDGDFVDGVTVHTHSPGATFFGVRRAGTAHGLLLIWMKPFLISSSICLLSSACLMRLRR